MIKVQFKNTYNNTYEGKEYTYQNKLGVAKGDIVVVNTANGFAIAKVSQVDVEDFTIDESKLKTIHSIVKTNYEIELEAKVAIEKRRKMRALAEKIKKEQLISALSLCAGSTEDVAFLRTLDVSELQDIATLSM